MNIKLSDIQLFINQKSIAVAGVSRNDKKFGNAIYKELKLKGYEVFPLNPNLNEYEGVKCYKSVNELPSHVTGIFVCTKPEQTEKIVQETINKGIKHLWLQQGSHNENSIKIATNQGINVVSNNCLFMFLEPVESIHKFHRGIKKFFGNYPK